MTDTNGNGKNLDSVKQYYSIAAHGSTKTWETLDQAELEATKLAGENIGTTFVILSVVKAFQTVPQLKTKLLASTVGSMTPTT